MAASSFNNNNKKTNQKHHCVNDNVHPSTFQEVGIHIHVQQHFPFIQTVDSLV